MRWTMIARIAVDLLLLGRRHELVDMIQNEFFETPVAGCQLVEAIDILPIIRQKTGDRTAISFSYGSVVALRESRVGVVDLLPSL